MALIALLWHLREEERFLLAVRWVGKLGQRVVESLSSASRSCASPLLAWKRYVGSIVVGRQQRMRRLQTNAAAGRVALTEV